LTFFPELSDRFCCDSCEERTLSSSRNVAGRSKGILSSISLGVTDSNIEGLGVGQEGFRDRF